MTVHEYRTVDIDVECRVDDQWYFGLLSAWRQMEGRWQGYVRWGRRENGFPVSRVGWFDQSDVRHPEVPK